MKLIIQDELVSTEEQTKVYENKNVLPRAFFVEKIIQVDQNNVIKEMFESDFNPQISAVVEEEIDVKPETGSARIVKYSPNEIVVETVNNGEGFLVLTDVYYPTWNGTINGRNTKIYQVDYIFRGVVVPKGKNTIIFKNNIL